MSIVTKLLQYLAIVVLVLAILLLVIDPRLRSLVVEDLSLLTPWAKSSEGGTTPPTTTTTTQGSSQPGKAKGSPKVTENGYTIAPECALWPVEGSDLYYSPVDPSIVCVQAPDSPVKAGASLPPGTEMPPNCDVAPDSVVYCLTGGQLTADTLKAFYDRGELQTPHEPKGTGG
jgi:hypothetical protein